jgi:hypothetical protein
MMSDNTQILGQTMMFIEDLMSYKGNIDRKELLSILTDLVQTKSVDIWIPMLKAYPPLPIGEKINVMFADGRYSCGIYNGNWIEADKSLFVDQQKCENPCGCDEADFVIPAIAWKRIEVNNANP